MPQKQKSRFKKRPVLRCSECGIFDFIQVHCTTSKQVKEELGLDTPYLVLGHACLFCGRLILNENGKRLQAMKLSKSTHKKTYNSRLAYIENTQ